MIMYEMVHDARIIRIDSEHTPLMGGRWLGDSVGHWEGDTLVVEAKHFRKTNGLPGADENLHVVVLQRTAENKFLRLEVENEDELAGNFPRTREELFRYRGLVIGSVEANFFTHDQLNMISDFIAATNEIVN